jgi:ABC-2 type transport system permease protein
MRIVKALIIKEFIQIVRDPSAILIALAMPLILLFIFGYGVNLDSTRLRVGLVVEGSDPESAAVASHFTGSRFFELETARSRRELDQGLVSGSLRGLVVIPASLPSDLHGPGPAVVQIVTDGSEPNSALFVRNHALGALEAWMAARREAGGRPPMLTLESRFWYNQELKSRNYLVPGSLAIVMTLIGVMLTALVISREWERGTMEALMATPVTINQIIVSKLAAYYLLALTSALLSWLVATAWYGVPWRGGFAALAILSTVYLFGALGQGLLISTIARNQFLSAQWAIISGFLPSFMLSGFVFEVAAIPSPVREVSLLVPARYFVPCLQTLFLTGDVWPLFWRSAAVMLAIGLAFYLATWKLTVRRIL